MRLILQVLAALLAAAAFWVVVEGKFERLAEEESVQEKRGTAD